METGKFILLLVECLNDVTAFSDRDNRDRLLDNLPDGPKSYIRRSNAPQTDLQNIVSDVAKWGRIAPSGQDALEILMANATKFVKDLPGFRERLELLQKIFTSSEPKKANTKQVVVVAMTREEADQLDAGDLSIEESKPQDYTRWQNMKTILQRYNVSDLNNCYQEQRDKWFPLIADSGDAMSIKDLLLTFCEKIQMQSEDVNIQFQFLSEYFFSKDQQIRYEVLNILEKGDSIVIIDAISMYHPDVRARLCNSSILSPNNEIAIIVISPLKINTIDLHQTLASEIYESCLERAFLRFSRAFDPRYEFGVGDVCNLQRWLYLISLYGMRKRGISPQIRQALRLEAGITPQGGGGIGQFVSGGSS